jgi:hypothetical protein
VLEESGRYVSHFTLLRRVPFHASPAEGIMENRTQVAHYAATLTRELCRMCRKVDLDDLAYLLEVAAAEAANVRATAGSLRQGIAQLSPQGG